MTLFCLTRKCISLRSEPYELFKQYHYLYLEGNFEDLKTRGTRSDCQFKHTVNYFKDTKFEMVSLTSKLFALLPFQLNFIFNQLCLQTNDYICASYFRKNTFIQETLESSFEEDSGKKITAVLFVFPEEVEVEF